MLKISDLINLTERCFNHFTYMLQLLSNSPATTRNILAQEMLIYRLTMAILQTFWQAMPRTGEDACERVWAGGGALGGDEWLWGTTGGGGVRVRPSGRGSGRERGTGGHWGSRRTTESTVWRGDCGWREKSCFNLIRTTQIKVNRYDVYVC